MTDDSDDYEIEIDVRLRDTISWATSTTRSTRPGTVLATLIIDYVRPITSDADVTVAVCVSELGTWSLPMEYGIRTDGKPAATTRAVQVLVDRESGRSEPIPGEWRPRIESAGD